MRKILFAFFALLLSLSSYAQVRLEYGKEGPFIDRDTIHVGDTFTVRYWLVNRSPDSVSTFNDSITTFLSTQKDSLNSVATLSPQHLVIAFDDSGMVTAPFLATGNFFKEGEASIVVVWPTGGGTESMVDKRQVGKPIYTDSPLSVFPATFAFNRVRIYPNPMRHSLTVKTNNGASPVTALHVTDLQGRVLPSPVLQNGQADLSYLDDGIYLLQIRFRDGTISTFRIIKQ